MTALFVIAKGLGVILGTCLLSDLVWRVCKGIPPAPDEHAD